MEAIIALISILTALLWKCRVENYYLNKRQLEIGYLIVGLITFVFSWKVWNFSLDPDSDLAWVISFVWKGNRAENAFLRILFTVMFAAGCCTVLKTQYKAEDESIKEYVQRKYGVIADYFCFAMGMVLCILLYARFKWEIHRPMLEGVMSLFR